MKIAIGSDHAAYDLKYELKQYIESLGHTVTDVGCDGYDRCNYADYGYKAAVLVRDKAVDRGILVCGTGIGIGLAANKVKGIRCATCSETVSTGLTRLHNDANMLSLGARIVGVEVAKEMVRVFLTTEFEGGRHAERIATIADIEGGKVL